MEGRRTLIDPDFTGGGGYGDDDIVKNGGHSKEIEAEFHIRESTSAPLGETPLAPVSASSRSPSVKVKFS